MMAVRGGGWGPAGTDLRGGDTGEPRGRTDLQSTTSVREGAIHAVVAGLARGPACSVVSTLNGASAIIIRRWPDVDATPRRAGAIHARGERSQTREHYTRFTLADLSHELFDHESDQPSGLSKRGKVT